MPPGTSSSSTVGLQNKVSPEDEKWIYFNVKFPKIPASGMDSKMSMKFITVTEKSIELKVEFQSVNRILAAEYLERGNLDRVIGISFANFRFDNQPPKISADYIEKLLNDGVQINGVKYFFYGHSNSQLKSRTCYLHSAMRGEELFKKINTFGDFSKINSIAKRAKRIGLLFSAAESQLNLLGEHTLDIDDVERNGHVFTDGCGLVSKSYAVLIAKKSKIIFHNYKYLPSVYQIRYKGYKGTVMVHPTLPKPHHFHFVKSMRKFTDCADDTFSILDYSKPYSFGFLNGELVTLLSSLGISDEVIKTKQKYYFDFLKEASSDPMKAFMYLSYKGENTAAEKILVNGLEDTTLALITRLKRDEWKGSYDKKNKERVRILIPLSRLLFGVSDHTGILKEGEVHVRIKIEGMKDVTISNMDIIVGRNPCLHPGDIRKFRAIYIEELNHLVDCIVFPIVGDRDAPSLMSGGDLDGDKFFVSWDKEIIPEIQYEPFGYPPAKEQARKEINQESMIKYFAQYNNASLGKVKNLYLNWVRVSDDKAGSKECQELNALFSNCVDGERIKIPVHLQTPPKPKDGSKPFILDVLCEEVKKHADLVFQTEPEESTVTTPYELMEFLLTTNAAHSVCLDEFELFQIANRWCLKNNYPIESFLFCFNFAAFTLQEKHIIACQFKERGVKEMFFQMIYNNLNTSCLLSQEQIRNQNLHHASTYWQKFYDSSDDHGRGLEMCLAKALELFDKKLLVFRVDSELTVAMYIAHKIIQEEELEIGKLKDGVKLFAFSSTGQNYRTIAERNYKIHFNGNVIQLFDMNRPNTFVWFALQNENFPSNRIQKPIRSNVKMYRSQNNYVETQENVKKPEFKVSIALQKFSGELSRSRSRVNKQESTGMEIYVISNRDRVGHQFLDLSMNQVETKTIIKLQKNIPKEYNLIVNLQDVCWEFRDFSRAIILEQRLETIKDLNGIDQLEQIFFICETITDDVGDEIFSCIVQHILTFFDSFTNKNEMWNEIFRHLHKFPKSSSYLVDKIYESTFLPVEQRMENSPNFPVQQYHCLFLLYEVVQSANSDRELSLKVFQKLFEILSFNEMSFSVDELISLVKSIAYSIRHVDVAEEFLRELFRNELQVFKFNETNTAENEACFRYLKKFTMALALDYLGEVNDSCPCDFWGIPRGAEDIEDANNESNNKDCRQPHNKSVEKYVLADFMNQLLNAQNEKSPNASVPPPPVVGGTKPVPVMKCLDIQPTDKFGFYKTKLRTDVQNKIRNGDHLRFCASRRSMDKEKRRITVFNAIADSIRGGELIFEMKERQPRELFTASWNVYICTSTTTFNAMLAALKTLISFKEKSTVAFKSILELPTKASENEIEMMEPVIPPNKFNQMQTKAITEAVNRPLTLIWGPPGTGKTTVVVEILLQFLSLRGGLSILVAASTHNAVDNVLSRFLKERASRFGNDKSEDVVRITSDMDKITVPELQKWTLNAFVGADIHTNDKAKREALKRLQEARVVFSTCSGAGVGLLRLQEDENNEDDSTGRKKKKKQKEQSFDVIIVDEASQITEPNALIPIVKKSQFVVLVGDHVQLRPTVSQIAKDCGLEKTLFEKLYLNENLKHCTKVMLNIQYRMNPLLAQFPSQSFYDGKLLSGVNEDSSCLSQSKFPWPKDEKNIILPSVFIQCPSTESYGTGSTSKINIGQVKLSLEIIKDLKNSINSQSPSPAYSITVLSPYTKQVAEIQTKAKAANLKVDVKTIDSFQGRESDIIIYSTVRANSHNSLGFLDDTRRMNVALTRAKLGFILIGDQNTLMANELWKKCIDSCTTVEYKSENTSQNQGNPSTNTRRNGNRRH